ncbi:MAG: hypothetical protein ACREM1_20010 [Longimicrobiales bacterium]
MTYEPAADPTTEHAPLADAYPFFPVSTGKFVAMSACTVGLYDLYWFYKNWQRVRDRSGESLSPFWRAFFAPLWSFSLFRRVHQYAQECYRSCQGLTRSPAGKALRQPWTMAGPPHHWRAGSMARWTSTRPASAGTRGGSPRR